MSCKYLFLKKSQITDPRHKQHIITQKNTENMGVHVLRFFHPSRKTTDLEGKSDLSMTEAVCTPVLLFYPLCVWSADRHYPAPRHTSWTGLHKFHLICHELWATALPVPVQNFYKPTAKDMNFFPFSSSRLSCHHYTHTCPFNLNGEIGNFHGCELTL